MIWGMNTKNCTGESEVEVTNFQFKASLYRKAMSVIPCVLDKSSLGLGRMLRGRPDGSGGEVNVADGATDDTRVEVSGASGSV